MNRGFPSVTHLGLQRRPLADVYHYLVVLSWPQLILWLGVVFTLYNAVFAVLYMLGGDCIHATDPSSFLEAFSFSVQTMTSTGYGAMSPSTPYSHVLTIVESFGGLVGVAMATGLMFSKFARPTARIECARKAVVVSYEGQQTFQFRMANQRQTQVVDAHVQVNALIRTVSDEGQAMTRLYTMELHRENSPAFRLSWTVIHTLDEDSPVESLARGRIPDGLTAIMISVVGLDEGFGQTVHMQHLYTPEDIVFDHSYADMMDGDIHSGLTIDHGRLHDVDPMG